MNKAYSRHRWSYPAGVSAYEARSRTCVRCGVTGRTYGAGGFRTWTNTTPDGQLVLTGQCIPTEEEK
jgi:hypothetical protein